ncbi:MAG: hypothetical protein AAGC60_01805 [Acidobacteriota bacterium]
MTDATMRPPMALESIVRFVFVLYCTSVGVALLMLPWTPGWDFMILHLPPSLRILHSPFVRGALSGFGLVHLVWGLHDLNVLLLPRDASRTD